MKKIILIISLFIFVTELSFAEPAILKENRIILKGEALKRIFPQKIWTPTEKETEKALKATVTFLTKNIEEFKNYHAVDYDKTKKILNHFSEYRVRFIGIYAAGEKEILCNFFHSKEDIKNWKEEYFEVLGGDWHFWSIKYDINTEKCFDFIINADA